jgi:hypothetical protein
MKPRRMALAISFMVAPALLAFLLGGCSLVALGLWASRPNAVCPECGERFHVNYGRGAAKFRREHRCPNCGESWPEVILEGRFGPSGGPVWPEAGQE